MNTNAVETSTNQPAAEAAPAKSNTLMDQNQKYFTKAQIDFIDHIVLIWMDRVRRANANVVISKAVIKAKAQEAAKVLNKSLKLWPAFWLRRFELKMKEMGVPKVEPCIGFHSLKIATIISEEAPKFVDDYSQGKSILKRVKPNDEPIASYDEALDCLLLVKNYLLSVNHVRAMELMPQIEELLDK